MKNESPLFIFLLGSMLLVSWYVYNLQGDKLTGINWILFLFIIHWMYLESFIIYIFNVLSDWSRPRTVGEGTGIGIYFKGCTEPLSAVYGFRKRLIYPSTTLFNFLVESLYFLSWFDLVPIMLYMIDPCLFLLEILKKEIQYS